MKKLKVINGWLIPFEGPHLSSTKIRISSISSIQTDKNKTIYLNCSGHVISIASENTIEHVKTLKELESILGMS